MFGAPAGRFSVEVAAEESHCQDLGELLELLTELLSKDFLHMGPPSSPQGALQPEPVCASTVVLEGLQLLLPLLSAQLLQVN